MNSRVQRKKNSPVDRGPAPDYAYQLLRIALERYKKSVAELSKQEFQMATKQAQKLQAMEAAVLASPEAENVIITAEQIAAAVKDVAARFTDTQSYLKALKDNRLDEESLGNALYRELKFDAVMNKISANAAQVSDLDVQIYYHMHGEKFNSPETRMAHHILITINPDYAENTREAARARIESVLQSLQSGEANFADLAVRHSECPSALQGGQLGYVKRGQLYPALDQALFEMTEGEMSEVLESDSGFHIVYCEEIKPAHTITLEMAQGKIRQFLEERQRNICQKAWLNNLMGTSHG